MEKLIFTAEESSFVIEAEGKKLRVSYDEFHGLHEDVMKFCKEHNGGDESVENLRFLAKHRNVINGELKKLGKETIEGWHWSNEIAWRNNDCAFVVYMDDGGVIYADRLSHTNARAILVV